eukprot:TRINITY_DN4533_c2_g1_i1.p1 TRINITY_DN4533_c2_g1~~TRINITY_DN4533_c2_g1_i1.p1  ORF type:complete len:376 (-),score=143.55 TRINITY_DN4533_c2_g1_i1:19-1146(-)
MTHEMYQCDKIFRTTFFLTYRNFTTPVQFLEKLISRYMIRGPKSSLRDSNFHTRVKQPIRIKIIGILKQWLTDYYLDFEEDQELRKNFEEFLFGIVKETLPWGANILQGIYDNKRRRNSNPPITNQLSPKSNDSIFESQFIKMNINDFAEQLTLAQHKLFTSISYKECLGKNWTRSNKFRIAPNLSQMIYQSQKITNWVTLTIDEETDSNNKIDLFKKFVDIAEKCREFRNLNLVFEIISGLERTKISLEMEKNLIKYSQLLNLIGSQNDQQGLREILKNIIPPIVPPIVIITNDLARNEDTTSDWSEGLINWTKQEKFAELIGEIQALQLHNYLFLIDNDFQNWIASKFSDGLNIKNMMDSEELQSSTSLDITN